MPDHLQSRSSPTSSSQSGKRRASTNPSASSMDRRRQPMPNLTFTLVSQDPAPGQQTTSSLTGPSEAFSVPALPSKSRMAYQSHQPSAKVAIPRLRRDSDNNSSATTEKHRVAHACEPCRKRKTKCSGERPVCKHCEESQIICAYADGKRDRTRK